MKVAVFVSAGLGDALLLVPLVKNLKMKGHHVSGIFTSPFHCEDLFYKTGLFDEEIVCPADSGPLFFTTLKNFRKFDAAYLNFFAATKKNFLLAAGISRKIITNNTINAKLFSPLCEMEAIEPVKGIHDATQNLRLFDQSANDSMLSETLLKLNFPETGMDEKKFPGFGQGGGKKYFAVQISSGNNIQKYKNWSPGHWVKFLRSLSERFPSHYFFLLGEPREKEIGEYIIKHDIKRIIPAVGKTTIGEAIQVIMNAEVFIGLDGGLMHIGACAGKPTFTLWGASDFNIYGYRKINPARHMIAFVSIPCRPCNSWISPNITRVQDPNECPDNECMKKLSPELVFGEFQKFYNKLIPA